MTPLRSSHVEWNVIIVVMWRHRHLYEMLSTLLWWHEYICVMTSAFPCDAVNISAWRHQHFHRMSSPSSPDAIIISVWRHLYLCETPSISLWDAIYISAWRRQHTSVTLKMHLSETTFHISMMPSSSPREKLNMSARRHQRHSVTPSLGESFLYFLWICNDLLPRRRPIEL